MPEEIKIEPVEKGEEVVVEIPTPDSTGLNPKLIITTKRTKLARGVPLTETHGMITEADRFKELQYKYP